MVELFWMNDVRKIECTGLTFNDEETMKQWGSALEARRKAANAGAPTDPFTSTSHMGAQPTDPIPADTFYKQPHRLPRPRGINEEAGMLDQWDPTELPEEPRPGANEPNVLDQWIEQRRDPEQRVGESTSNDKPQSSRPFPLSPISMFVQIDTASDCVFMIHVGPYISYDELMLEIRANPGFQAVDRRVKASTWKLKYQDEDGDKVAIQTDEDVREAIFSRHTSARPDLVSLYMTPHDKWGAVAEDFPPDAEFETHEPISDIEPDYEEDTFSLRH